MAEFSFMAAMFVFAFVFVCFLPLLFITIHVFIPGIIIL